MTQIISFQSKEATGNAERHEARPAHEIIMARERWADSWQKFDEYDQPSVDLVDDFRIKTTFFARCYINASRKCSALLTLEYLLEMRKNLDAAINAAAWTAKQVTL